MRSFFLVSLFLHVFLITALYNAGVNSYRFQYCNQDAEPKRFLEVELSEKNKSSSMSDSWSKKNKGKKSKIKRLHIPPDKKQKEEMRRFKEYIENEYSLNEKDSAELLDLLKESDNLKEKGFSQLDHMIPGSDVDEEYIYRKRRYKEIIVKDVFPTIHTINIPFESVIRRSKDDLIFFEKRNNIIKDYHSWKGGQKIYQRRFRVTIKKMRPSSESIPLLKMGKDQRMKYLDSTLKTAKEKQLEKFIEKYLSYHPDKGDLPGFIRELYYENLQRLAYRFSFDPTFFFVDYFQENLNKESFLKNAIFLLSRLKDTKSGIELGFTIENIYEIQSNAWDFFYQYKKMKDQMDKKDLNKTRIKTLNLMDKKYSRILKQKNIYNEKELKKRYFQKRIEIMNFLNKNNTYNYRLADIYYQKGEIYWQWYSATKDPEKREAAFLNWNRAANFNGSDNIFKKDLSSIRSIMKNSRTAPEADLKIKMFFLQNLKRHLASKKERESRLLWGKKK